MGAQLTLIELMETASRSSIVPGGSGSRHSSRGWTDRFTIGMAQATKPPSLSQLSNFDLNVSTLGFNFGGCADSSSGHVDSFLLSFTQTHTTGCHLAFTMDTPKNSAFVFIKPHAVTDDVKSLVNERTSASHHTCSLTHTHAHEVACRSHTAPHSKPSSHVLCTTCTRRQCGCVQRSFDVHDVAENLQCRRP